MRTGTRSARRFDEHASVLVIVLWISFGLVSLALYFGQSMAMELRAADNRGAARAADQAITGAARYVTNLLAAAATDRPGQIPALTAYRREDVPIGDATFWLLGRSSAADRPERPVFGLTDEASRLPLNTATLEMLQLLPRMTPELAAAIVDWRDTDSEPSAGGAEDEIYLRLNPAYHCKNAPFESVEELRLVYGVNLEILYGEDTNQNGILDANENDGDASPPADNRDGRLDPGLVEFLTVSSREAVMRSDGSARLDLSAGNLNPQQLATLLQESFGTERANQILQQLGGTAGGFTSPLAFYARSRMTAAEFAQIEDDIMVGGANAGQGLVNVNTASESVLACLPGIGLEGAANLVARRQSNTDETWSMAWVTEVLDAAAVAEAGPFLTGHSYQFAADIASLGPHGRGFRRVRFVCDLRDGTPRMIARRELTPLGWALGREVRTSRLLAPPTR